MRREDGSAIHDEQGMLRALEGSVTDVSEVQKRADFEQQLIGIVSHDLRNPVSTMLLATARLLGNETLEPGVGKTLLRIQRSGEHAEG
jgi:signal transduction histidine kinase